MTDSPIPKVEFWINGSWVAVTSRTRAASMRITTGRTPGGQQAESARLICTVMNDDGWLTEGNPLSPWYPHVQRGCRIRVSGVIAGTAVERVTATINTMRLVNETPDICVVQITATGTLQQIGQGSDPLLSPIRRTMIGTAPGDYVADFYWPGEDAAGSLSMASAISGIGPVMVSGPPAFASDTTLLGSDPLPAFAVGQGAQATLPAYAPGDKFAVAWWMKVEAEPAAAVTLARMTTSGTIATWSVTLEPGSPSELHIIGRDAGGTTVVDESAAMDGVFNALCTEGNFYGNWFSYSLEVYSIVFDLGMGFSVYSIEPPFAASSLSAATFASLSTSVLAHTPGNLKTWRQPGHIALSMGHLAVHADTAFDFEVGNFYNAKAQLGWAGEEAADRFARLCTEQGIAYEVLGSSSVTMGAQRKDTLGANLQDCEDADHGLLHDGGLAGAVVYVCSDYLINQGVALTVPKDALADGLTPIWDNLLTANDVTSSRPGGASARVTDEDHIAKVGRRWPRSPSANVETDEQVADDAGWTVRTGTAEGPRYDAIEITGHSTSGAAIADDLAALTVGNRIAVDSGSISSQHPPGGLDQLIVGAEEFLDRYEWTIAPVTLPYAPYIVGVLAETTGDTDPYLGWLAADSCDLHASVNESAISWQVNSVPLWSTTADDFPTQVVIGGEPVTVTAVTGGSNPQTWTVARSTTLAKDHTAGDDIELVHPIILTLV